jgi:hypothetical protein
MSRWADLFGALSDAHDKGDTTDKTKTEGSFVACVTSVTPPPDATMDIRREGFVSCVRSVNAATARGRANEADPETEGSFFGGMIDALSEDWAREPVSLTLRTQLTQWSEAIARLRADNPPADVPLVRWRQFLTDARHLFSDGVIAQAAASGWTAYDLFGCDDERPFARVDQWGLVWFVEGSRIVSLSMSAAVIETPTGARQTYRRKDGAPGRILVWESRGKNPR